MSEPEYLLQTADGVIHGYFTLAVLLIDIACNKGAEPVTLYKRFPSFGRVRYEPCTEAALREIADHVAEGFKPEGSCLQNFGEFAYLNKTESP